MLCGVAWSMPALIAFRVLQGLGGGMLLPLVRVILGDAAGKQRMGRAMVFVAVPGGLTPVLGPVLGGLVTAVLGWRWAFYINAPICLLGLMLAWRLVPGGERGGERDGERGDSRNRLDLLGLGLLSAGLAALVDGLAEALEFGKEHAPPPAIPATIKDSTPDPEPAAEPLRNDLVTERGEVCQLSGVVAGDGRNLMERRRPVLTPVPVQTRSVVVLLDQLDLHRASLRDPHLDPECVRVAVPQ